MAPINMAKHWTKYMKKINWLLLHRNIKRFKWWAPVRNTMITKNPFILIPEALELIGNIRQKYHLLMLKRYTGMDISDFKSIVEIGGGYGAMHITAHDGGFDGEYTIYDFAEMLCIQKYYINSKSIYKCRLVSSMGRIKSGKRPSLLIALWSLSEMPTKELIKIEEYLYGFDYYLITLQKRYDGKDNLEYFDNLKTLLGGHARLIPIPHIKNDCYLIINTTGKE